MHEAGKHLLILVLIGCCCLPWPAECLVCCLHTIVLLLQAADGTTTLAQQLPKALQEAVQEVSFHRVPEAYRVIAKAQQQQLQQQQAVIEAQQQRLEQLQGEIVQLRQGDGGRQAGLAAELQQLST